MTKTHAMGSGITYGRRYLLGMIFNLAVCNDDDGNAAGGWAESRRAAPEKPRTVAPAPKHALKPSGIAERAITARYEQAVRSMDGRSQPFLASEAGKRHFAQYDERNPPPGYDEAAEAARALNRRLHPMNDELPAHSAKPKLDTTERDPIPAYLDRRKPKAEAEPSYLDLVGGAHG